jgi:hypothetical protein
MTKDKFRSCAGVSDKTGSSESSSAASSKPVSPVPRFAPPSPRPPAPRSALVIPQLFKQIYKAQPVSAPIKDNEKKEKEAQDE